MSPRHIRVLQSIAVSTILVACTVDREGNEGVVAYGTPDAGTGGGGDASLDVVGGSSGDGGGSGGATGGTGGVGGIAPDAAGGVDSGDAAPDVLADTGGEGCAPLGCVGAGYECGVLDDGCGGTVACGTCTAPNGCHDGRCSVVVHVDGNASGANDGSSWTDAFVSIQDGVDAAEAGQMVWVAEGSFDRGGSKPVVQLKEDVQLFGGFAGTETNVGDRMLADHETVLDGRDTGSVVIGASRAAIDGFTIIAGKNGGIDLSNVDDVMVSRCRLTGNGTSVLGGGVKIYRSSATIENTTFESNEANEGGGVSVQFGQVDIRQSAFLQNRALVGHGGAINAYESRLTVSRTVFDSNTTVSTVHSGGAIANTQGIFTVANALFYGNTAGRGGALYIYSSPHTSITHCTFHANQGTQAGIVSGYSLLTITNSILWNNGTQELASLVAGEVPSIRHSVVTGHAGPGIIEFAPMFFDPTSGDLRLRGSSPCIDAADGDFASVVDFAGNERWDDPATPNTGVGLLPYADMGALEYQP